MSTPKIIRPQFPEGYLTAPKTLLTWEVVEQKLVEAVHYWVCTIRPSETDKASGLQTLVRPHAMPTWAVWVGGKLYFDGSPETRRMRNLARNPYATAHLESGEQPVIVDGLVTALPSVSAEFGVSLATAYRAKYAALGYAPEPDQWQNGGLYELAPHTVIAWTKFTDDPTKFVFA